MLRHPRVSPSTTALGNHDKVDVCSSFPHRSCRRNKYTQWENKGSVTRAHLQEKEVLSCAPMLGLLLCLMQTGKLLDQSILLAAHLGCGNKVWERKVHLGLWVARRRIVWGGNVFPRISWSDWCSLVCPCCKITQKNFLNPLEVKLLRNWLLMKR